MRRIAFATCCLAVSLVGGASAQDGGNIAALAANNEGNLQMQWGWSVAEAKQRASEACWRVSRTCANDPAHTIHLDDVFAYICCSTPRFACGNSPHESRQQALNEVIGMMSRNGFSNCSVRGYLSARTGRWEPY